MKKIVWRFQEYPVHFGNRDTPLYYNWLKWAFFVRMASCGRLLGGSILDEMEIFALVIENVQSSKG